MGDSSDDIDFTLTYPLWILCHPGPLKISGALKGKSPSGALFALAFTDQDLAQTALDSAPNPSDYELKEIHDPLAFVGLLVLLGRTGVVGVSFDSSETIAKNVFRTDLLAEHFALQII